MSVEWKTVKKITTIFMMLDDMGRRRCWFSKRLKNTDTTQSKWKQRQQRMKWNKDVGWSNTNTQKSAVLHSTQWARTLTIRMDQYVHMGTYDSKIRCTAYEDEECLCMH